jgi:hypothetical protein
MSRKSSCVKGGKQHREPHTQFVPFVFFATQPFGVADLAQSIGWDISRVLEDAFDNTAFLAGNEAVATEAQLQESLKAVGPGTILTIRWNSGEASDYRFFVSRVIGTSMTSRFSATPYQILSLGPQILTFLRTAAPTRRLPKEDSTKAPQKGAYVDEEARTLWVWETETLDPRYLDALTRRWPGWQVYGHVEGLVRHVILSGRDPAPLSVSMHQAILELTDELTRDQSIDPLQVSQAIRQALPPEDQPEIRFGTGFFSKDASPLSPQEQRDVLNRLFSELLENGQMKREEYC